MYLNTNTVFFYFLNTYNTFENWPSSEVPLLRLVSTKNDNYKDDFIANPKHVLQQLCDLSL